LKKPIEWSLKTWLAPWAYVASVAYHDMFWYPVNGKRHVQAALASEWGRLFANWGNVPVDERGFPDVGKANVELIKMGVKHFLESARLIGMAVTESPEVKARQRNNAHAAKHRAAEHAPHDAL